MALADELQLKGLAGSKNETCYGIIEPIPKSVHPAPNLHKKVISKIEDVKYHSTANSIPRNSLMPITHEKALMATDDTKEDLQLKIDSMIERDATGEYKCTVCGKTTKYKDARRNIRQHVETHIEGVAHVCSHCEKVSRSSRGLQLHILKYHQN